MPISIRRLRSAPVVAGVSLMLLFLAGCNGDSGSDGINGPGGQPVSFAQDISFSEFEGLLASGVTRVEVELLGGGVPAIAREIEVELDDDEGEEIESHVIAPGFSVVETGASCGGSLTLAPEGLEVTFDLATAFELDEDDGGDDSDLSCDEFVARIQDAITAGREPRIEVQRPASGEASAPDAVFAATKIELEDSEDGGAIQLQLDVDEDNLMGCDVLSSPPDGCLGVLQVATLMVVIQDGVTELEAEQPDAEDETEFEGLVASVDPSAGTFTLTDGRTIRVIEGTTEIEIDDDDEDEYLTSLEEVEAALSTMEVEAEGEAVPDPDNADMWIAIEVEFEIED